MPESETTILELEAIIQRYTTYFLLFDIVFAIFLLGGVILLIHFAKSRKKLKESKEYLLFTIQGQEEERGRIARELHDTVAQNLRYCKSLCETTEAAKNLPQIAAFLSKLLVEVRSMSYNLAPPDITKNDFLLCVKNLCQKFSENSKIDLRLSILENTDASFLTKDEILNLYRIVQEALTNVLKHAGATEIVILVRNAKGEEENGLYIFISDDGKGFDTENIDEKKHFGLRGMKNRADLIRAGLFITSEKDSGTQIKIISLKNTTYKHGGGGIDNVLSK